MSIPSWITAEGGLGNYRINQTISGSTSIKLLADSATTFTKISGDLPPGLSLSSSGLITGTFGAISDTAIYEFIVRAGNVTGYDDRRFSILVIANNYPNWITPAGSLGGFTELTTMDPITLGCANPVTGNLTFKVVAGSLPAGITLVSTTGIISGTMPALSSNVKYEFTVRATNSYGITDRTFSMTVKGVSLPEFQLNENAIIAVRDSKELNYQIIVTDSTPGSTLTFNILSGNLPPNVTLTENGILTGVLVPTPALGSDALEGWDVAPNDKYGWDLNTNSDKIYYSIVVLVDNGFNTVIRKLKIFVVPYYQDPFTNPVLVPGGANDFVDLTSPQPTPSTPRNPLFLTSNGPYDGSSVIDLGNYRHDNYYLFKFDMIDFDNDLTEFYKVSGNFPPGLTFDKDTGWLYGTLPYQFSRDEVYTFSLLVRKVDLPAVTSDTRTFTLTILGEAYSTFTWQTDSDLGILPCGIPVTINIQGSLIYQTALKYAVTSGSLPPGLELQIDGTLVGRPSFNQMNYLDTYTFTVNVTDYRNIVDIEREFTVKVQDVRKKPYENLYIKAFMPVDDRQLYQDFINDFDIFDVNTIYRPNDPNFGVSKDVRFLFAYGLDPNSSSAYTVAMRRNFFDKRIFFGDIKTARAVKDGNVLYEVVYVEINESSDQFATTSQLDTFTNTTERKLKSNMTNRLITADNEIVTADTTDYSIDVTKEYQIFPNTFDAMQESIQEVIGNYDYDTIPLWMSSKQEDGTVLGFRYAVVIAYVKPGLAKKVKLRIERNGFDFKKLDFVADRLIWDNNMSEVWNLETSAYVDNGITQTEYTGTDVNDKYLIFPRQGLYRT